VSQPSVAGVGESPLAGIRVVEVAHFVAVPAAGALLADLGAEVVKVERPGGELYRHGKPAFSGYASDFPESPAFHMDNRGKRSLALDLTRPGAREALARVVDGADVVLTNLLPQRRRRYGLDPDSLLARRPGIVVGAITGYGAGGPDEDGPAFDYTAYWARSGMMDTMRDAGVPPSLQRPAVGDHAAAMNLVCGVLVALRRRDATGRGGFVDVSLLQTGLHVLGNDVATALVTREPARRHDRRRPVNPLWNSYPVKGDRWLLLVMIEPDRYWSRFCAALGRPDLETDPRFASGFERHHHAEELVAELERTFAERTLAEWRPILDAHGLIWSPVSRVEEAIHDRQARHLGLFYDLESPAAGRFETVAPPFRIQGVPLGAKRAAPPVGGDTREVLREAGLSEAEIAELL